MRIIKDIKILISIVVLAVLFTANAKSTEECFENTSRAIFKFNMALDDIVLEPLAKGYNKLPSPIKTGTSNFTSNIGTLLSIPNNILQGNFRQQNVECERYFIRGSRRGYFGRRLDRC